MSEAYKYYKDLPGWSKAVIILGGGLVVFFVGKSIWDTIGAAVKPPPANLQEAKDAVTALNSLSSQGINPTATDAQFQGWANDMAQALGGCWTTTSTINTVLSNLNNDADMYKLIAVFGNRSIKGCLLGGSVSMSLSQAVSKNASSSEIGTINSVLATKGITFVFS